MGISCYHSFKKHSGNGFSSCLYETCFYFQCNDEFFSLSSNHMLTYFYVVLASITNNMVGDVLFYILTCSQPLPGAHFGCRRMSSSSDIFSVIPCCCNDMLLVLLFVLVLLWNLTKFC
jgi:hypothetical protein